MIISSAQCDKPSFHLRIVLLLHYQFGKRLNDVHCAGSELIDSLHNNDFSSGDKYLGALIKQDEGPDGEEGGARLHVVTITSSSS